MVEKYNIIKEVYYKNNFYFLSDKGDILSVKNGIYLPNSPIVSWKFNDIKYFDKVEKPESDLEKLILKETKDLNT